MGVKSALVTGGSGFLGSHLCRHLLDQGFNVLCVDNLVTGRVKNIAAYLDHARFKFLKLDVRNGLPDHAVDEVWNLACPASPRAYQADPIGTMLTNILGTKHALDLAVRCGARIVQASTSEVYGDPEVHPQREDYKGAVSLMGPRACYDEGKRASEVLCFDYHRQHGVDVKIARIFNTYGPGMDQDDGRVVSNFIVRALQGEPLEVYGTGAQTRSFCYVDDLIAGLLALMRADSGFRGPVNIGNDGEFSVRQLAEIIKEITGSNSAIVSMPLPEDDPLQRRPDLSLAKAVLKWEATIPLREGIARTIGYFANEVVSTSQHAPLWSTV